MLHFFCVKTYLILLREKLNESRFHKFVICICICKCQTVPIKKFFLGMFTKQMIFT